MPVCAYLVYLFVELECVLEVRKSGYPTPHLPLAMFWIKHSICSLPSCCVLQQVHLYTLSLSHRRSFYSSPSHPPWHAHTLSDPPKKQCLYTHTHTLVVVSHNPTPWRVTVADCQPKLAKEPKPRHGRIYAYILYINAHKHSTSTGPALDEQWLKCN